MIDMNKMLCASMMCANYDNLAEEIKVLDHAGIDSFHCDIMDGNFVPNFAMGLQDIACIRKHTDKMIDAHLMVENPSHILQAFIDAGCDLIYIHPESERYVVKAMAQIHAAGKKAGVAINPDTSIETVKELLYLADYVMVMTVNPGFAGQKYIDFVTTKIMELVKRKTDFGFKLTVDGACSPERIKMLSDIGVDGFVLGTSALFGKGRPYSKLINELREL